MKQTKLGAWDCPTCGQKKIWANIRSCPSCGTPCGVDNVRYYLPDDAPTVEEMVTELSEEIPIGPDWKCSFCDTYNRDYLCICKNCGGKRDGTQNYFEVTAESKEVNEDHSFDEPKESIDGVELSDNTPSVGGIGPNIDGETPIESNWKSGFCDIKKIGAIAIIGLLILSLLIIFIPRKKEFPVSGFSWERTCYIEEYKTVNKNGWTLPSQARVRYTSQEIHHYDKVQDGYKTETYSEKVQDGYETKERTVDKGNGYFDVETYSVPKYKTVQKTRQVPKYKDVPVYRTKYYYEIDEWVYQSLRMSAGIDKDPYWALPITENSNPKIGDTRVRAGQESYYLHIDATGKSVTHRVPYEQWQETTKGDIVCCWTDAFEHIYFIE